jgi:small-conductance mechanosensitive channel
VAVFGVVAAAVSLAELVMAAWLQYGPVTSGQAATAGTLWSAIHRIDGVKMFVLAAMAVALAVLSLTSAVLPRWLAPLALLLAVALVLSGLGYVLLAAGLSDTVWVSGILLLIVITATGVTLRSSRPRAVRGGERDPHRAEEPVAGGPAAAPEGRGPDRR